LVRDFALKNFIFLFSLHYFCLAHVLLDDWRPFLPGTDRGGQDSRSA
jgi:hypothetical protein